MVSVCAEVAAAVDDHRLPAVASTKRPTQDVSQSQPISAGLNNPTIHDASRPSNDISPSHPLFIQQERCRTPMPFVPKQVLTVESANGNSTSDTIIQNE
jgi:hypothetical protein